MESRYKSIKHIGEGAFSSVILALNIETGEKVAIKKMKKRRWKDTAAQAEISALQKLCHENIIRLLDVFREDYRSFLVFECMDCDLNELVVSRNGRRLPETVILDITYQVLNGLDFIHRNDLFHRDIKPENVLIRRHVTGGATPSAIVVEAKIADFGLVHDMDFSRPLTDYISTRWYRAPEVLLNCANYSTPIDVWAVGTIVAELATLRPLFPGTNQIDQLRRIFEVLGTPRISSGDEPPVEGALDGGSWYEGAVHARKLGIAFVPSTRRPVASVMPDVSPALTQLVDYLLVLNPANRPTARDALVVVSRMLDHTLGEPQECEAVDPPNHQVPEDEEMEERVVPEAPAPVAGAAKRLLRIPPIMGKTRSTGTMESVSAVVPATPVSDTPPAPPVVAVSRPSVEISIVHEMHREPMRDPRADLSDLAVTKDHKSHVQSRSVSSVSSMGSGPRSLAVSPDSDSVFGSSTGELRPAVPMCSAIGKNSLLSALAQEELAREQRLSLQRPRAMADARVPSSGSSETGHIRRAGAIAELGSSQVSSSVSVNVCAAPPAGDVEEGGYVPLRSNGAQQTGDRVQGLRNGGQLMRRALSTKKTTPDSGETSQAPSKASSLLRRSRSVLTANPAPSTGALLELSPNVQAAVDERIDLSRVGAEPAPSVSSGKGKKDEWIANMQFLRQRLASNNIGHGSASAGSSTASGNESVRHMMTLRGVRRCSASSDRPSEGFALGGSRHALTVSKRSSVAATPVRDVSLLHISPESAALVPMDDEDDFLGVRRAMHSVLLASPPPQAFGEENDVSSLMTLPSPVSAGGDRDLFAPVTFDAAALFRQSLLGSSGPKVEPPVCYREDSVMPSPGDKISTFNDVRLKYSSRKPGAPASHASGAAGGHRFLSKVKNALTGGHSHSRLPDPSGGRLSSHAGRGHGRAKSSGTKAEISAGLPPMPPTLRQPVASPPRLDFDLGISLITPDSLHGEPARRVESRPIAPQQSAVANDSTYYLIDYINGQQPGGPKERSDSYVVGAPGAVSSTAAARARAARRVVNTSTRSRQTQYEYSFGSQIFECLDKDLVLLKTDAFKEIEEQLGVSSTAGNAPASAVQPYAQRLSNSLAVHKQYTSGRPAAPRRKPMDVTKVTAKTAAAINNIVAGNAKARSNVAPTAASGTGTNSSVRQLVI
ncbi:hypothetical protein H4218_003708 [Coemansia sp. IMI 209128]|nr:hypothetical protein H4218_003708 [Coemansia sp. IMI 209128]